MRCVTMREQMSSQGLQSQVGRCEGCLPASLPASLSLHRKPSCTRLVTVYILLTLLEPCMEPCRAPGWCPVYSVTVARRGLRQLQDQHRLCSLRLINDWPWSSRVIGEGTMAPCAVLSPSVSAEDARKSLSAHSSALAGASPCLSEMTNSRVQGPRGELKTTVN